MSLSDDLARINDAVKDRRGLRRLVGRLNKQNQKEQISEQLINSAVSELMNIFSTVQNKAANSSREIHGMIIKPKPINYRLKGTEKDPRVLVRFAMQDPDFNRMFKVTINGENQAGKEEYVLTQRTSADLF